MPKPVVAAVQGAAAGFGLSLVLAADLALAAEDAIFASGYIHLGTSPDGGMTMTLPRIVGLKRAAELMLLGDRFDARRALELGLVNRLVPPAALEAEAMALATRLANGPTHAYGRTKALLAGYARQMLDAQLGRETESFAACAATEEFVEGVRAFLEKRRPNFSGLGRRDRNLVARDGSGDRAWRAPACCRDVIITPTAIIRATPMLAPIRGPTPTSAPATAAARVAPAPVNPPTAAPPSSGAPVQRAPLPPTPLAPQYSTP